ncbi:uncharacterized protein LOC119573875 [Penaeus monodon]|uniref:uncharacterized protein LOC119573875 n=1 Tax=Penaeus monodon TaxID=6687 RepID=UPI0018A6DC3B|nr:uncharacterized protein LOC119573875 [Penaeus monodon]
MPKGSVYQKSENSFPLTKMGLFFHDSFFKDSTEDFRKAVREILRRWGEASPEVDELTRYRILRSRDSREETQAVTSLEDDRHHKFVIDVHDFMDGGEVSAKAVNERELVVEGHLEKKGDGSKSSKRFLRRFVVPGDIHFVRPPFCCLSLLIETHHSALSSDGILSVISTKKGKSDEKTSTKGFSSETRTRMENKTDSGHSWEEKNVAESSKEADGYSVRTFASSSRAHHHHSYTNHF